MERGLRDATLSIVPADLREDSETILPIGFSPFLHCWTPDDPNQEIALANHDGYATIERPLPVGTALHLKAITPLWLSIISWISVVTSVIAGFVLLAISFRKSAPAPLSGNI